MSTVRVAVVSGKGGAGKTTVAVNVAQAFVQRGASVVLADCDVEAPNCALFLDLEGRREVESRVAAFEFDAEKCTACGRCVRACRFNAIALVKGRPLVFSTMCHGCGGCLLACPSGGVRETTRVNGRVISGRVGALQFIGGQLTVGEAMAAPLIDAVRRLAPAAEFQIIDSPPGASCAMLAAAKGCDVAVLVAEPTPFGLHDLGLARAALEARGIPIVVAVNRDGMGDRRVHEYCVREALPIAALIPASMGVARACSEGKTAYGLEEGFTQAIDALSAAISRRAAA